jgi:hypothetical protein
MNATEKTQSDETEFLLAAIRGAILRAQLDANEFKSIGLALRSGWITPDCAMEWLATAGLIDQVILDNTNDRQRT